MDARIRKQERMETVGKVATVVFVLVGIAAYFVVNFGLAVTIR